MVYYTQKVRERKPEKQNRERKNKMKWRIFGQSLKDLIVTANSFDEALAIARKCNPNYNGGQRI